MVVQNGRIVERGTHDELIRMNGVYKRLGRRQFGLSKAKDEPQSKLAAPAPAGGPAADVISAVELIKKTLQGRRRNNPVQNMAARVQQLRTEPERLKVLVRDLQSMEARFQACVAKIKTLSGGAQ